MKEALKILLILFLIIFSLNFIPAETTDLGPNISCVESGTDIREISEGNSKSMVMNTLSIGVGSADETNLKLSATLILDASVRQLDSDNPSQPLFVEGSWGHTIELISASDTAATIRITDSDGVSDIKEINEGSSKEVNRVLVFIVNADETNLKLSAIMLIGSLSLRLSSDNPSTKVKINGKIYTIGLVSASDTTATIRAAFCEEEIPSLSSCTDGSCKLYEGETLIVNVDDKTYEVFIEFIDSTSVKFNVNGEVTSRLSAGENFKLSDNSKIKVIEVNTQDYQGGLKFVRFLISSSLSGCTDNSCELYEGETVTFSLGGKMYKSFIEFIDSTSVKLNVNGEVTSRLSVGDFFKLSENSHIEITEITFLSYHGGVNYAKFIITTLNEPCTKDAKICDDGTIVGRNPDLNCKFDSCPISEEKRGFRFSYWQCHDGDEEKQGSLTSCKSSLVWVSYAKSFCENKCSKETGKCGLNSFSVSVECDLEGDGEEIDEEIGDEIAERLICKDSCPFEDNCLPISYRQKGEYCSGQGLFKEQLKAGQSCDNNFECSSNVCVSGECVSSSLIERILNFFRRLFGRD